MTKIATIQLLIEDAPDNSAEDIISDLLCGADLVVDWAYAQTREGEFTRPLPFPDVDLLNYREGDFTDRASEYAIVPRGKATFITNSRRG